MSRFEAGEVITAMVTPFKDDLSIDFEGVEKLVAFMKKFEAENA